MDQQLPLDDAEAQTGPRVACVIDYETTGVPENELAEVIEMGRVLVDLQTLELRDAWTSLVKPVHPIPPETKAVHHITEAYVEDAPRSGDLWRHMWAGVGKEDVLVAHNAKFEQHFHHGNGRPWICTYKCARAVWPDAPSHGNQALRYWLGVDDLTMFDAEAAMPPHRALPDAYVTAFILRELLRVKTVEELIHISKYPALLKKLTFGKHKGMTYAEAPADYLEWIRDKSDMDEDVKFSAKYWLAKRREAA
jgi:exodeoxyribonuclease X